MTHCRKTELIVPSRSGMQFDTVKQDHLHASSQFGKGTSEPTVEVLLRFAKSTTTTVLMRNVSVGKPKDCAAVLQLNDSG